MLYLKLNYKTQFLTKKTIIPIIQIDDNVDDWGLTFSIDREEFGETIEIELVNGGANIPVTFENRKDYVKEYINYVFNKSCLEKYRRFAEVSF